MPGVSVFIPRANATARALNPVRAQGNWMRVLVDTRARATTNAVEPFLAVQETLDRTDFREQAVRPNYGVWSPVDNTQRVLGWRFEWLNNAGVEETQNPGEDVFTGVVGPERSSVDQTRAPGYFNSQNQWTSTWGPSIGGKFLRRVSIAPPQFFQALAWNKLDEGSPEGKGNVDLKVRFRIWPPYAAGGAMWTWSGMANRFMAIIRGQGEFQGQVVYGYAVRENFEANPPRFDLIKLSGPQEFYELARSLFMLWSRSFSKRFRTLKKQSRFQTRTYRKVWNERSTVRALKKWRESDPSSILALSGRGSPLDSQDPEHPMYAQTNASIRLVDLPGIPTGPSGAPNTDALRAKWLWVRLKGHNDHIQAKVWVDGTPEPDWQMQGWDDENSTGFVGVAQGPAIQRVGGLMGAGTVAPNVGDVDIDVVEARVSQVPAGNVITIRPEPADALAEANLPFFFGSDFRYVWTDFDLNQTDGFPQDWFMPRPDPGPSRPAANGVPRFTVDMPEHWRVRSDPELLPEVDRSSKSLVHATRNLTQWAYSGEWASGAFVVDPSDRYVDPNMARDAIAYSQPYPGADNMWAHDGQIDDGEILVRFRWSGDEIGVGFWVRGGGTKGRENGYYVTPIGNIMAVFKFVNGEWRILGLGTGLLVDVEAGESGWAAFDTDTWYWMRIKVAGASDRAVAPIQHTHVVNGQIQTTVHVPHGAVFVGAKYWEEGDYEPEDYQLWAVDTGANKRWDQWMQQYPWVEDQGFTGYATQVDELAAFKAAPFARYRDYIPPHDRGFVGLGGPQVGARTWYTEYHVATPLITKVNNTDHVWDNQLPADDVRFEALDGWAFEAPMGGSLTSTANAIEGDSSALLTTPGGINDPLKPMTLVSGPVSVSSQQDWLTARASYFPLDMVYPRTDGFSTFPEWMRQGLLATGFRWYDENDTQISQVLSAYTQFPAKGVRFPVPRLDSVEASLHAQPPPGAAYGRQIIVVGGHGGHRYVVDKAGVFRALEALPRTVRGGWGTGYVEPGENVATLPTPAVRVHKRIQTPVQTATAVMRKPTSKVTRPQHLPPVQDLSRGSWVTHTGATTGLWDQINELWPNDADFIRSAHDADDDTFVARLQSVENPDPDLDSGYIVAYRFRKRGLNVATLRVVLLQGTTEIASWTEDVTGHGWVSEERYLTQGQIDSITDYQDLRLALVGDVELVGA